VTFLSGYYYCSEGKDYVTYMMTIPKCFSLLIASGNGQRCNDLRIAVRKSLITVDEETNKCKLVILKFGRDTMPDAHKRASLDLARDISPLFMDISEFYYSEDFPRG